MEYNTNEKMNTTAWVNMDESQTMTNKISKLQKNTFNMVSFMFNINMKKQNSLLRDTHAVKNIHKT